jgi:hypothetical protein
MIPLYIGKKNTQIPKTRMLISTAGRNLITPGKSKSRWRTSIKENKNEIVIKTTSQQKMIQRGAYLFLKKASSIWFYWANN